MTEWWEQAVVYEIYPRSFSDSDGDGIGDLEGIVARLDHLEWLGVDAIWIAPIYPSPLDDYGYDVADHAAIAPEYGDEAAFARLIEAAHGRGIKVLIDLVASHTSIEHPWFTAHRDRYVWVDAGEDGSPPNNWIASFGGPAWSPDPADPASGRLYLHSFFAEQPDLDWRNPEVRDAMGEVISRWTARGVDGFRIDALDRVMKDAELRDDPPGREPFPLPVHPDTQHLDLVHSRDSPEIGVALEAIRAAAGDSLLVGEVYLPAPRLGPYLEHLDRVFSFDLLHSGWDAAGLAAVLAREAESGGERLAWVISNHDFSRVATRWGPAAVRAAAMMLLTLPGCAFIYQGEELGQADGPGSPAGPLDRYGRDVVRHPPRWSADARGGFSTGEAWLPADTEATPADEQRADPGSIAALYRDLIAVRRGLAGPLHDVEASGGVLGYRRGDRNAVHVNTGLTPAPLRVGGAEVVLGTSPDALSAAGELAPGAGVILAS